MSNRRTSRFTLSVEDIEPRICPSSGFFGNVFDIMKVFQQIGEQQRATVRESRELTREAQHEAIQAEAAKIREAANVAFATGISQGAVSIASGAVSVGSSQAKISALGEAGKLTPEGRTVGVTGQTGSLAQILGGIGQLGHSALLAISDAHLAEQKVLLAEARERQANQAQSFDKEMAELQQQMAATMQKIQEQLARMQEAQAQIIANLRRV